MSLSTTGIRPISELLTSKQYFLAMVLISQKRFADALLSGTVEAQSSVPDARCLCAVVAVLTPA